MHKPKNKTKQALPIVEILEPRVLFSADSFSALGSALLTDDTQPQLDELFTELALPHPLDSDVPAASDTGTTSVDNARVELVFIDSRVPDLQTIVDDITANKTSSVMVVVIDHTDSGVDASALIF